MFTIHVHHLIQYIKNIAIKQNASSIVSGWLDIDWLGDAIQQSRQFINLHNSPMRTQLYRFTIHDWSVGEYKPSFIKTMYIYNATQTLLH